MTTPETNSERADQLVAEMIEQLRALQGSGEYPPLNRRIVAGDGLQGGGTLEADRTLALGDDEQALLQALEARGDLTALATTEQLQQALEAYARTEEVPAPVSYRDFTVTDAPAAEVTSPPLRMDSASVVERVTVTVGTPGTQPVTVRVASGGRSAEVEVPAGGESASVGAALAVGEGALLTVAVGATTASRVVVSLRVREEVGQ